MQSRAPRLQYFCVQLRETRLSEMNHSFQFIYHVGIIRMWYILCNLQKSRKWIRGREFDLSFRHPSPGQDLVSVSVRKNIWQRTRETIRDLMDSDCISPCHMTDEKYFGDGRGKSICRFRADPSLQNLVRASDAKRQIKFTSPNVFKGCEELRESNDTYDLMKICTILRCRRFWMVATI